MKNMKKFALLLPLLLSACTYGSFDLESADRIAAIEKTLPTFSPAQAQICFLREGKSFMVDPGVKPLIRRDGKVIGELPAGGYFCAAVPATKKSFYSAEASFFMTTYISLAPQAGDRVFVEWLIHEYGVSQNAELAKLPADLALSKMWRIQNPNAKKDK